MHLPRAAAIEASAASTFPVLGCNGTRHRVPFLRIRNVRNDRNMRYLRRSFALESRRPLRYRHCNAIAGARDGRLRFGHSVLPRRPRPCCRGILNFFGFVAVVALVAVSLKKG